MNLFLYWLKLLGRGKNRSSQLSSGPALQARKNRDAVPSGKDQLMPESSWYITKRVGKESSLDETEDQADKTAKVFMLETASTHSFRKLSEGKSDKSISRSASIIIDISIKKKIL